MAEKLGNEEVVSIEEVVLSHSYEIAALVSLLEKKGLMTRAEVVNEIKRLRKLEYST